MLKGICYNASRQERRKCSLWHAKSPGVATSGAFLFRCGKVAYALGWLESYKADLEEALEELKDMRADWKPEKEPNMNEEIELIKKWVKEREDFINE